MDHADEAGGQREKSGGASVGLLDGESQASARHRGAQRDRKHVERRACLRHDDRRIASGVGIARGGPTRRRGDDQEAIEPHGAVAGGHGDPPAVDFGREIRG